MRTHLGENARMALITLRENKLRSFLTVLAVVIGITAVIAVISILVGLDRDIRATLNDYGTDTLFVFKFSPGIHTGRLTQEERTRKPLTFEDAMAIKEQCPSIKAVAVHSIGALAYDGRKAAAEDEIRGLLRRRRNVPRDKPDTFGVSSAEQITNQVRQITGAVALLIFVISSIGLLVGGVGVMNIMLMSVTQRTREIGVRRAIGARRRDVIWQFLTEAMTLTGAGGVIGVLLGLGISLLINATLPQLPSAVPLWAVVVGVLVAMSVGLFFGMYPAVKAARLDPVEALRYE